LKPPNFVLQGSFSTSQRAILLLLIARLVWHSNLRRCSEVTFGGMGSRKLLVVATASLPSPQTINPTSSPCSAPVQVHVRRMTGDSYTWWSSLKMAVKMLPCGDMQSTHYVRSSMSGQRQRSEQHRTSKRDGQALGQHPPTERWSALKTWPQYVTMFPSVAIDTPLDLIPRYGT
jgi:hypothetical protein